MSFDHAELFPFGKYDVSAFKRTIKRVFSTISTPHPISNMPIRSILDFWHISIFREGAPKRPEMLEGCSIRFQAAQYSYFTDSERSWPPASTQYSYECHTLLHKLPKKHVLWEFSMAHSSSGWVLILSKIFWLKNMDRQL